MENKTPIKQAIEIATGELYQTEGNIHQRSYNEGIRDVLKRLESLLPKEKEFVEKAFQAGADWATEVLDSYIRRPKEPDIDQFINQLYPEK